MSFSEPFWNIFIIVVTLASLAGCYWLVLVFNRAPEPGGHEHVWDEDLRELNNPLPRWWVWLFVITLAWGVLYLLLYPGLGSSGGFLGWSQERQYEEEIKAAQAKYGPLYARYRATPIPELAKDPGARRMGERLFASHCAACHGSDAGGGPGYPNLRDGDWLWGGSPEAIEQTISRGRQGAMPAWREVLGGDEGVRKVAAYVLSLSGREVDPALAAEGKPLFQTYCAGCHGQEGKGNPAVGAPDLTDEVWLYGGSPGAVERSIAEGRSGKMPAWEELLGPDKVHVLAAYIYGLSHGGGQD